MEKVLFGHNLLIEYVLTRLPIFDVLSLFQTCKKFTTVYKNEFKLEADENVTFHLFKLRVFKSLAKFYNQKTAEHMM